jgi:two-component system, OmpR family, response regulator
MTTCLLVDDDSELRQLVSSYLTRYGMGVRLADSARAMRAELARGGIDVVLLDIMLPDGDGIELCRELRQVTRLPVIMVTAQGDPISRVLGLEMGADDYVSKPFEPRELLARINALVRRSVGSLAASAAHPGAAAGPGVSRVGDLGDWQIDWRDRMLLSPDGVALPLSNVEYRLLATFAENPGQVLSRQQLAQATSLGDGEAHERAIDLAVSRLRAKLRESPESPRLIQTVRGRGYQFIGGMRR